MFCQFLSKGGGNEVDSEPQSDLIGHHFLDWIPPSPFTSTSVNYLLNSLLFFNIYIYSQTILIDPFHIPNFY